MLVEPVAEDALSLSESSAHRSAVVSGGVEPDRELDWLVKKSPRVKKLGVAHDLV